MRDIWNGRTWYRATFDLDPNTPISNERLQRRPGRPKGVKDKTKRNKKVPKRTEAAPLCQVSDRGTILDSTPADSDPMLQILWPPEPQGAASSHSQIRSHSNSSHGRGPTSALAPLPAVSTGPPPRTPFLASIDSLLALHAPFLPPSSAAAAALHDPFHDDWAFWPAEPDRRQADDTPHGLKPTAGWRP